MYPRVQKHAPPARPEAAPTRAKKIEKDSALWGASHIDALAPSIVLITCSCVLTQANRGQSSKVVRSQHNKGRLIMKTLIIAAVLIAGIATPAFAQSFDPDNGTGNIEWRHVPAPQNGNGLPAGQTGDNAYASAPKMGFTGHESIKTDEVGRTGGGSLGYNENLKQY
jgi:hypothetical protein